MLRWGTANSNIFESIIFPQKNRNIIAIYTTWMKPGRKTPESTFLDKISNVIVLFFTDAFFFFFQNGEAFFCNGFRASLVVAIRIA